MIKEKSISIIVPCLNEAQNLEKALLEINEEFSKSQNSWEVIVIDDGSTDNTFEIGEHLSKTFLNYSIVRNEVNLGLAKSFYKGVNLARNDYVVFFPGDNEISARSLRINAEKIGNADILICYPENPGTRVFHRAIISKLFIYFTNLILNQKIKYYNGSNIYRRSDIVRTKILSNSFAYQVLILSQLFKLGRVFEESPFKLNYSSKRNNPISIKNFFYVAVDLARVIKIRVSKNYEK